jgi:hypothetical protein
MKKIPDYNRKNIDILLEVYSGNNNPLYFLDANKGKPETDLLTRHKQYEQEKETICSFFFDDGSGFSEEKSLKIKVDTSLPNPRITEEVPIPQGCRSIRIDPCEGLQCAVSDASFTLDGEALAYTAINGYQVNNLTVFPTEDPQFLVQLPNGMGQCLKADMPVRFYSSQDMLFQNFRSVLSAKDQEAEQKISSIRQNYVHRLIEKAEEFDAEARELQARMNEKDQQIQSLEKQIEEKDRDIYNIQGRCVHAEQELARTTGSFFWKITKPARAVLDALKKGLRKCKWLNLTVLGLKWRIKYGKEEAKRLREEYINWNYR